MRFLSALRRTARRPFGALLIAAALLLAGCTPLIQPEGWPGLTVDGKLAEGRYEARYLYVAYRNTIFRVDTQTPPDGRPRERLIDWAANATSLFVAPALGADGTLYAGSYNHQLFAFSPFVEPRSTHLASFTPPADTAKLIADPLVYGDAVYQGLGSGGLGVYDLKSGALRASFTQTQGATWSKPIIDEASNTLYFASMDQYLYALSADTLTFRWKLHLDGAVGATPVLDNDVLYIGTFSNEMLRVDVSGGGQGVITHRYKTDGWVWSTPVLSDGVLYFGCLKGQVYALDAETFDARWRAAAPGPVRGSVAVVDDRVIAASENRLVRAFRLDSGATLWTSDTPTEDRILGDVVVIGDEAIFTTLSANQMVVAISLVDGGRTWSVRQPNNDDFARLTQTPVTPR